MDQGTICALQKASITRVESHSRQRVDQSLTTACSKTNMIPINSAFIDDQPKMDIVLFIIYFKKVMRLTMLFLHLNTTK